MENRNVMASIEYRTATVDDSPAIANVEVKSKRASIADLESEFTMGYDRSLERWSGYIAGTRHPQVAKPERAIYVACEGPLVVGYIGCHHAKEWGSDFCDTPLSSELQQVYVLKSHQRLGVGTQLFSMVVDWLRDTNVNTMGVGFHEQNPYQAFYLKMGGRQVIPGICVWDDLSSWSRPA